MPVIDAKIGHAMGHDEMQEAIALLLTALPGAPGGHVLIDMTPRYTRYVGDFGTTGADAFDIAMRRLSPDPFARERGDEERKLYMRCETETPSNHARIEARRSMETRLRAAGADDAEIAAIFDTPA